MDTHYNETHDGTHIATHTATHTATRLAAPADLDAIAVLHAEARATYYRGHLPEDDFDGPAERARTREGWAGALTRQEQAREQGQQRERGAAVLCAEYGGALAGVAAYGLIDTVMTLTQLHVSPAHWRHGIGTALHTACVAAWRETGVKSARLEVFEPNLRARSFYERHGWYPDPDTPRHDTHLVLRLTVA
ncbi:GNAT family N-acetyltransferase [Streptomyces paludis]|uniref:GNAT family N-acetyltransferase n=1 Tax=Streptomyces paludis TaxID=2282738 RepID=A0A345I0A8_9ACTN|nr:GNAT family N-acetyltransferase [Streptomyces paludis]AXG82382.1 GNAT family N-acetyltransferase [Streptomyces paludis]